jgi:hypothetical protein
MRRQAGDAVVAGFRLLGPIEARVCEQPVDTGQPRQRNVLAALLVDAGSVVPWDTLIDRVGRRTAGKRSSKD